MRCTEVTKMSKMSGNDNTCTSKLFSRQAWIWTVERPCETPLTSASRVFDLLKEKKIITTEAKQTETLPDQMPPPHCEYSESEHMRAMKRDSEDDWENSSHNNPDGENSPHENSVVDDDDDDEYIPDSDGSSSDTAYSSVIPLPKGKTPVAETLVSNPTGDGSERICQFTSESQSSRSKEKKVSVARCVSGDKRVWNKKHSCLYCSKVVSKLARHLEQKHSNETDVAYILSLPKKSKERKARWQGILKKGDFHYNMEVLTSGSGVIIPCKRPRKEAETYEYVPCTYCFGMFLGKDLWKHAKRCQPGSQSQKCHGSYQAAGKMLIPLAAEVSDSFRRMILSTMTTDEIASEVNSDPLILAFGERLFKRMAGLQHQHNYVKQKLRELGRFLTCVKRNNPQVQKLQDCIDPGMFQVVTNAVKALCKFDETGRYGIPSLALKIGQSLKKCAEILKSQALQSNDDHMKQKASAFMELHVTDWATEISSLALQTIHMETFNKPKRLPLAEDLKLLNSYLEKKALAMKESLNNDAELSSELWRGLNEITLAQIVLFNRRRGGETERIELSHYKDGISSKREMQEEIAAGLSSFEKSLAASLDRIEIRGKRGRKVPVLFTKNHRDQIECLLKHRTAIGINPSNPYLFPRCGDTSSSLRSSDVLRKFAVECGAKQASLITSTSLRKHVATISQILNLKNHELDALAHFLGHDIQVHRNFYRLPEDTIQIAKVSKILVELEKGNIAKYTGQSLDEINIEQEEEIEGSDDTDDEDVNEVNNSKASSNPPSIPSQTLISPSLKKTKPGKRSQRVPWTSDEKAAVKRQLGKYLRLDKLPGKAECEEAKQREPVLQRRPWSQIKFFIRNARTAQMGELKKLMNN